MTVILYSTGCPKCNVLKKKLAEKGIEYSHFTDADKMLEMGFREVPVLSVDGKLMNFTEAVKWINNEV